MQRINADGAYAVWQNWQATGDDGFLCDAGAKIILEDHVHRYGPARIGRQINVFEFEIAFEFLEKSGFGIKTGVAIVASTVRHCFSSASPRSRRDDSPVQHSGQRSRSKTADQIASASITVVILP